MPHTPLWAPQASFQVAQTPDDTAEGPQGAAAAGSRSSGSSGVGVHCWSEGCVEARDVARWVSLWLCFNMFVSSLAGPVTIAAAVLTMAEWDSLTSFNSISWPYAALAVGCLSSLLLLPALGGALGALVFKFKWLDPPLAQESSRAPLLPASASASSVAPHDVPHAQPGSQEAMAMTRASDPSQPASPRASVEGPASLHPWGAASNDNDDNDAFLIMPVSYVSIPSSSSRVTPAFSPASR